MKKIDRTGEVKTNLEGLEMKIVEYKNNKEVRVVFTASGETRVTTYLKFRQGKVFPTWRNRHGIKQTTRPAEESDEEARTPNAIGMALFTGVMIILGLAAIGIVSLIATIVL